jgi:hypothetical protein
LYVSDGGGALRIFDSNTFAPLKSFSVSVDADPIVYDPVTHTTQPGAATGHLVTEAGEYLVMAPAHAGKPAQVLVYSVVPAR